MRVTIGQVEVSADHAANLVAVGAVFRDAARVGTDLLVLPEYAAAFDPHGTGPENAEPLDGPFVTTLRRLARQHGVAAVAGTLLPGSDPARAVNAVVGVDADGGLVGVYRKVHLYDAFGHRESERLEPGDPAAPPLVLDVGGLTFGVMTCYDLRFPESARRLVDAGADVLVVPAAWAAGPLKADHWRTLARARAIENTAVVLAVGQAGRGVTGRSLLVGPDGQVGIELGERAELRTADLDPAALAAVREQNPSLANRRYVVVPRD
ncbi:carbon-nitrogen hydrolase family protein [Cellulosimicrobium sp. CUA-896]|uniref:carbon-nitrogen hydrolase family protein n=1 Tax=Cellulosimicrobium sp. CUA-896 TaxID=1517881 RepID=UPI0009692129|nr:carbon-nitrogen hydrolase family protein [Cellulosimicrobium sp. CUA-896]OLT55350.1 hydrolase [Cellulosimicrobium sp. CUA-896]